MYLPPPPPVCINPSQDPKTLKQCTQLTKQENDTCCFGEIVNVPICKTCAPNQMLYNGKCTDTTDLGCCFTEEFYNVMGPRLKTFEYSCNMETGHNCTLTTKKDCFPESRYSMRLDWAALGSKAYLGFAQYGVQGFVVEPTCSLDLSFKAKNTD